MASVYEQQQQQQEAERTNEGDSLSAAHPRRPWRPEDHTSWSPEDPSGASL
jgi:hypothetical protein